MATKKSQARVKNKTPQAPARSKRKKATKAPTGKKGSSSPAKPRPVHGNAAQIKSRLKSKSRVKSKTTPVKTSSKAKFNHTSFPIVGIGGSAGGLQAFEDFFANMDSNTGMAFVVVTHLHPGHVSALPELIAKCSSMEVLTIKDGMMVRQNCIYLIPPGVNLAIFNRSLHLTKPYGAHSTQLPIDFFFRSLAEDQKDKAIGIIMSGTGTDGTLGMRAIKGESGMIMVQNLKSARFSGEVQIV